MISDVQNVLCIDILTKFPITVPFDSHHLSTKKQNMDTQQNHHVEIFSFFSEDFSDSALLTFGTIYTGRLHDSSHLAKYDTSDFFLSRHFQTAE